MGNHKDVYKSSDSEYYAGFHWPIGHVTCTLDDGKSVQDPSGKNQNDVGYGNTDYHWPQSSFNYDYIDYSVVQQT